jgi:hypothetical protein
MPLAPFFISALEWTVILNAPKAWGWFSDVVAGRSTAQEVGTKLQEISALSKSQAAQRLAVGEKTAARQQALRQGGLAKDQALAAFVAETGIVPPEGYEGSLMDLAESAGVHPRRIANAALPAPPMIKDMIGGGTAPTMADRRLQTLGLGPESGG